MNEEQGESRSSEVRRRRVVRLAIVVAVGLLGGAWSLQWLRLPDSDFEFFHAAARILLAGGNPYAEAQWPLPDPYWYPLPAALVLLPFSLLPLDWAGAAFFGMSSAAMAWGLTRQAQDGWWPLVVFMTPAYLVAGRLGQWSPLLMAGALWPALDWVIGLKPNLGLALFLRDPRWRPVFVGLALGGVSLLINPAWPLEWRANLQRLALHPAPLTVPGGALLLVALLRWRRPDARLLATLACVPQVYLFADQLLLTLIARTPRERCVQALLMWVGFLLMLGPVGTTGRAMVNGHWYVLGFAYLPALVMVLRRPNEGAAPGWLVRALAASRGRIAAARQSSAARSK